MAERQAPDRDPHDPYAEPQEPIFLRPPAERFLREIVRQMRRLVVLVAGLLVVLVGMIMIVTPGPAFIVIPTGLAILAIEFAWARRLLIRVRERAGQARDDYWRWYHRDNK